MDYGWHKIAKPALFTTLPTAAPSGSASPSLCARLVSHRTDFYFSVRCVTAGPVTGLKTWREEMPEGVGFATQHVASGSCLHQSRARRAKCHTPPASASRIERCPRTSCQGERPSPESPTSDQQESHIGAVAKCPASGQFPSWVSRSPG